MAIFREVGRSVDGLSPVFRFVNGENMFTLHGYQLLVRRRTPEVMIYLYIHRNLPVFVTCRLSPGLLISAMYTCLGVNCQTIIRLDLGINATCCVM